MCLDLTRPLNFSLSRVKQHYYFIGIESFYQETLNINIGINSSLMEYNTTNLSKTVCNFSISTPQCTIPLHHTTGQEMCVLASLEDTTAFATLCYFALPHKYTKNGWIIQFMAVIIVLVFALLSAILAILAICKYFRTQPRWKERRN